MYLLVNLKWSEILSSRPVYAGALKTNFYSITSLIPIFLEWQKAVYWSANGKNLILRQKFCLKSFDPTILNGAQQMILVHIQRTNLVASIKNGIKHFLFSTTATIAQKSLLIHLSGCPPKSGPASLGSPVNLPFIFCGWKGLNEEWLKSN